ncbi:MAG: alpha-L-fucosidase [Clostridia bacterium]|nr:alpha-L-fucosidase [Clostridia bacterium]
MKKFEPTFESLRQFECPKWFKDAKFGIWSHWGPQSVPMYGDWYARAMYIEGSDAYKYHLRHYGHPSEFGYKDLCELWKAEKFDPDALMDLYVRAGAKYFVAQAVHHDNFFNYDSKVNKFNSVNVGPKKDICMEWKKAAEKRGLPFGLTEHLAASFSWFAVNKGADKKGPYAGVPYDGNDPDCPFYYDNKEHYVENPQDPYAVVPWYTQNEDFHRYWLDSMKELIDKFEPDLLYSDGALPFHLYWGAEKTDDSNPYAEGLEAVSYLYNKSIEKYGENRAVYNQKERAKEIYSVGILDIEKSQLSEISSDVWQTDTCIGNWFYDVRQDYKTPGHIIEMLVDIISKNGVMLLNILQRPDGSIDKEAVYILEELEKWFKICAEAVYETEPWRIAAEGDSAVIINKFQEDRVAWRDSDFRFVKKDNFVYAYIMAAPESRVSVIKSFTENEKVRSVTLLGYGKVEFSQAFGVLTVKLPAEMPTSYTNCLKIEL